MADKAASFGKAIAAGDARAGIRLVEGGAGLALGAGGGQAASKAGAALRVTRASVATSTAAATRARVLANIAESRAARQASRIEGLFEREASLARRAAASARRGQRTTILGENMAERVEPFAERTGARTLGFGAKRQEWDAMTPRERWKLNDRQLRVRIREGDRFRSIGIDPDRSPASRQRFDLTRSEILRLAERGIPVEDVSPEEVFEILGRY